MPSTQQLTQGTACFMCHSAKPGSRGRPCLGAQGRADLPSQRWCITEGEGCKGGRGGLQTLQRFRDTIPGACV